MRAQVEKAQLLAGRPQEPVFHEEDVPVEAEEQPDWVNVYAGQNQRYEGIEREFYDDDGGDDYDWTSTSINIPQGKDPKTWLQMLLEMMKNTQAGDSGGLELPDVCPLSLNRNQRSIVSLVLHTLYNFVENRQ